MQRMERDFDDVRNATKEATATITDGRVIARQEKMSEKIQGLEMEKFKLEQTLNTTKAALEKAQADVAAKVRISQSLNNEISFVSHSSAFLETRPPKCTVSTWQPISWKWIKFNSVHKVTHN